VLALDYLANDPDLQIHSEAKRLLSRLQLHTPGQAPSLSNELLQLRLTGAALFADRDALRTRLFSLSQDAGPPAVIVNGDPKVGKSHTRKLLNHASQRTNAFRLAWVEIEQEQAASYPPDWT